MFIVVAVNVVAVVVDGDDDDDDDDDDDAAAADAAVDDESKSCGRVPVGRALRPRLARLPLKMVAPFPWSIDVVGCTFCRLEIATLVREVEDEPCLPVAFATPDPVAGGEVVYGSTPPRVPSLVIGNSKSTGTFRDGA